MSYVNKKIRAFKEAGDVDLNRKRSDGRMKTYQSATDARAWCGITEDRRQHILDLIKQGDGKGLSLGKYIPIEAIIDILLANKNAEIRRYQKENEELRNLLKRHGIKLDHAKEKALTVIQPIKTTVTPEIVSTKDASPKDSSFGKSPQDSTFGKSAQESSYGKSPQDSTFGKSADESSYGKSPQDSSFGKSTEDSSDGKAVQDSAARKVPEDSIKDTSAAKTNEFEVEKTTDDSFGKSPQDISADKSSAKDTSSVISTPQVATSGLEDSEERVSSNVVEQPPSDLDETEESKLKVGESGGDISPSPTYHSDTSEDYQEISGTEPPSDTDEKKDSPRHREITKEEEEAAARFLAGKSPEDQLNALKDALAEKDDLIQSLYAIAREAIEKLECIKDIVEDRDELTQQQAKNKGGVPPRKSAFTSGKRSSIDSGRKKLPETKGKRLSFSGYSDSCRDDIASLEREIAMLKQLSSPEAEIVKREIELLKKYCAKLNAIQSENIELRRDRDMLPSNADDALKSKLSKLNEITQERDRLRARVQQLEQELKGFGSLPEELESFKRRSLSMIDDVMEDQDNLLARLENLHGLEDEVRALKLRSGEDGECEELKQRLAELEKELENMKCKCKDLEILRVERDCLKNRVDDLKNIQKEYEDLLKKTQGFEALKAECAKYKAKYEELKDLEFECNQLRAKMQVCNQLQEERELLMKKIEDCECCMHNQDKEINKLVCHIDCLTQDLDKRQDEMKCRVISMRSHLEKKDSLIAKSEQKLADVQDQLRSSIESLACETTCLRNRIEELEIEVSKYKATLFEKEESYKMLMEKFENEKSTKEKLEEALSKAIKNDKHLKEMLKQSKCAIKCIAQKLENREIGDVGQFESEKEDLLKKIRDLENKQLACGEEKIADLEEELRKARETIDCLRKSLEDLSGLKEENKTLRKHSTDLQETVKDHLAKIEEERDDYKRKSQQLEENQDELKKQLEEERLRRGDAEDALTITSEREADECAKFKKEIEVLSSEIDRLNFELERLQKINDDLHTKLQGKSSLIQVSNNELEELRNEIERLKKELEAKDEEINQLKSLAKSETKLDTSDDFAAERDELLRQIAAQKKEIADLVNKIKEPVTDGESVTLQELEKRNKENENLKSIIADLERQLNQLKDKPEIQVPSGSPEIDSSIKELTDKLDNEEKRVKELEESLKKCQEANEQLKSKNAELENELKKMKQKQRSSISSEGKKSLPLEKDKMPTLEKVEKKPEPRKVPPEKEKQRKMSVERDKSPRPERRMSVDRDKSPKPERRMSVDRDKSPKPEQRRISVDKPKPVKEKVDEEDPCKAKVQKLEDELAKQKRECSEMIANLKNQYERDIKNLQNQNRESIDKLQKVQQETLSKISEQHEDEIENFKNELRKSEASISKLHEENKTVTRRLSTGSTEAARSRRESLERKSITFQEHKQPIPEEEPPRKQDPVTVKEEAKPRKLSIKTFDDVCICGKLPTVIPIAPPAPSESAAEKEPCICAYPIRDEQRVLPQHRPGSMLPQQMPVMLYEEPTCTIPSSRMPLTPQQEIKVHSVKKIAELENKLLTKQKFTKEKIDTLQNTVERFRRELALERQKNSDLISRYTNQSKTVTNMQVEIKMVKQENLQDKKKLEQLNKTLKNILDKSSSRLLCPCSTTSQTKPRPVVVQGIPHFHTEVALVKSGENKFQHNCTVMKKCCSCSGGDLSTDSYEIDE